VGEAFSEDMHDLSSMADRAVIKELLRQERDDMLRKQIEGCMLSRAALNGVPEHRLGAYVMGSADQTAREWRRNPEQTRERLEKAQAKYDGVVE
jgi:hypothetical protein